MLLASWRIGAEAMLCLSDTAFDRNCQGLARREFLRIGGLTLGGLTLPGLLAARARAAAQGRPVTEKSVVLLFLQGGPPQFETFDPKMGGPSDYRSVTGEVATKLPGVTFGGTFPQMAAMADRLAVVRSYASRNSDHTYLRVTSGGNSLKAAMGAVYARVAGSTHPLTGMPSNALVLPEAVSPGLKLGSNFETGALPTLTDPGELGPACAAFNLAGGGQLQRNMELTMPRQRFDDRRHLLGQLDALRRQHDARGLAEGLDKYQQQAFDVIVRGASKALDLSQEDPRTIERYDTSRLFSQADTDRWYDMKRSSNLLGKQLLLARRLCEAGCGFVTVSDCGWDMHSNGNSPKHLGGMYWLGPQVDHAVAAFLTDVAERGLSERILLVITGEMGRTPRLNRDGGRDHWGNLTPLVLAGGGLKMGQVVGRSDRQGGQPATTPYDPSHLLATILHVLLDVGTLRVTRNIPREIVAMTEHKPLGEVF
jgi:uncharacterized protein (DUF1501 family)